jgi:hypothetical protein
MNIFVGYGYNDSDKWIEEYVFPLLVAMGCQVDHGKIVYGGLLPAEIVQKIQSSDAMMGFTTRRGNPENGRFPTHEWVIHELTTAATHVPAIPWVEVRERDVIPPGGILDAFGTQQIEYSDQNRAKCLVEVAQAVGRFQDQIRITTVRLGPDAASEIIATLVHDPSFRCQCQMFRRGRELPPEPLPVLPIKGALFVRLKGVARDDLVRITIFARQRVWRSSYESVDTVDIRLVE